MKLREYKGDEKGKNKKNISFKNKVLEKNANQTSNSLCNIISILVIVPIIFQVGGTITASANLKTWTDKEKWIHFETVDGLVINGGGQIDGQGSVWWNACSDKVQIN